MVGLMIWYTVSQRLFLETLLLLLLFYGLIPGIYFFIGIKKGKFSDWDITNKTERRSIYYFAVVSHLLGVLSTLYLHQYVLFRLLLVMWVVAIVFMSVNLYWKISVHAGINALLMLVLNEFWGFRDWSWMLFVLLLVLWSRVYLKKHTMTQVVAGAMTAYFLGWVGLKVLGL